MSKKIDSNRSYLSVELLCRDNDNTPDFLDRKLEKHIPVFVYGTLKTGQRLHSVLGDAPCLGDAYTVTPTYTMKQADAGFPVIFNHSKTAPDHHHVMGEVYIVNASILLELDRVEGNGEMYQRDRRWVWLLDQQVQAKSKSFRPAIRPWVYLGMKEFWDGIPLVNIPAKKGKETEYLDWQGPSKSNILYAPKSNVIPITSARQIKPAANYMQHYPDQNGEGGDIDWSDIMAQDALDWKEYDEAMAQKKAKSELDVPWMI